MSVDAEKTLSARTFVLRRSKIEELLLDAHSIVRTASADTHADGYDPHILLPADSRRRIIALLVRVLQLVTEGWTS